MGDVPGGSQPSGNYPIPPQAGGPTHSRLSSPGVSEVQDISEQYRDLSAAAFQHGNQSSFPLAASTAIQFPLSNSTESSNAITDESDHFAGEYGADSGALDGALPLTWHHLVGRFLIVLILDRVLYNNHLRGSLLVRRKRHSCINFNKPRSFPDR